jgi:putative NADPH-quinone reductase
MKILYVYAHPNPVSLNSMLKKNALDLFSQLKLDVKLSDLYADQFKAIADWDDFRRRRGVKSEQLAYDKYVNCSDLTPFHIVENYNELK